MIKRTNSNWEFIKKFLVSTTKTTTTKTNTAFEVSKMNSKNIENDIYNTLPAASKKIFIESFSESLKFAQECNREAQKCSLEAQECNHEFYCVDPIGDSDSEGL